MQWKLSFFEKMTQNKKKVWYWHLSSLYFLVFALRWPWVHAEFGHLTGQYFALCHYIVWRCTSLGIALSVRHSVFLTKSKFQCGVSQCYLMGWVWGYKKDQDPSTPHSTSKLLHYFFLLHLLSSSIAHHVYRKMCQVHWVCPIPLSCHLPRCQHNPILPRMGDSTH